ncbi:probable myosin-binding protein 6 [Cajanus cajan]|uniref:probable myosin-binding protein 6 n=1 Tax=Cajanus cajan TaxID=3821 RepID=UPI00098D9B65|nr:probable myosin-binding protein 6 [Cajanus cajan]XP_020224062.1 probable myosin-binding protein 6 [Cajanus cajan]
MAENMKGSVISRSKSDVAVMRETLRAQQQLLEKLYAELDEEREASATAASEALDMILRLQGEKAVVKMEASHYKRMTEEKIGHAEASLEAFEDLMYQKEMQIACLEFQVQAYRHKLMSLGYEYDWQDDLLLNRSDKRNGENGGQSSSVRRLQSMPTMQIMSSLRAAGKRDRSPSPVLDVIPKILEEGTDMEVAQPSSGKKSVDFACGSGNLDSYFNQIKELNEQVRMISDCAEGDNNKNVNLSSRRGRSCSILSQATTDLDELRQGESTHNRGVANDSPSLLNVHDVYEVPEASEKHEVGEKVVEKWNHDADNRLTKPDSLSEEVVEPHVKHGAEKKKGVHKLHREIKTPCAKDMTSVIGQKKEGTAVDRNSLGEFQRLKQRIERLERERVSARQEITEEGNDEEQLRLLKDIQSQLQLIQSEVKGLKTRKPTPKDDVIDMSLASLQEAMLHFWL